MEKTNQNCTRAKNENCKKLMSVEEDFPKRVVIIAIIVVLSLILGVFIRLVGPRGELFAAGH
jgi:hypothetical protein